MNKKEFVTIVSGKTDISQANVEKVIKATLEAIEESLVAGESVSFVGFGTFTVADRAAREGKNPLTGEKIKIAATKVPKFKAGKALKEAVASSKKKRKK